MAGGQSAQILQQVEGLLTQLAQEESQPEVQQAVQGILKQIEPLQQLVGQSDMQDMQGGLNNPSGAPVEEGGGVPPEGMAGGGQEPPSAGGAPGGAPSPEGGGEHHVVEVHIGVPSKTFAGARKAAMATHRERGHFSQHTPAGERPSTDRTKSKARG